jgi:hypothetical protein
MEPWISQSHQGRQNALSLLCIAAGLVLLISFRHHIHSATANELAGLLLGALIFIIGIAAIATTGKQTIVVDPLTMKITITDETRFRKKVRSIPFKDIVHTGIGYLGKRSNFVNFYYLVLKLRTGEEYPLFSPGRFYHGTSDRGIVEGWQQRLESYLAG